MHLTPDDVDIYREMREEQAADQLQELWELEQGYYDDQMWDHYYDLADDAPRWDHYRGFADATCSAEQVCWQCGGGEFVRWLVVEHDPPAPGASYHYVECPDPIHTWHIDSLTTETPT